VATCAVLADAIGLRTDGVSAPDNEMLVLVLLFAASFAVVTFSEYDVRRVSIERRSEIAASTLGRLQNLARLLATADTVEASHELARLRETFPTWGLLAELQAYVQLLGGEPREALRRIESLVGSGGDLYVSPVVGVACWLELSDPDAALALLASIERRRESVPNLARLHRALAVSAGHLPALLAGESVSAADSPPEPAASHRVVQALIGQDIERRQESVHRLALDLDPAQVPGTKTLIATLALWERAAEPADFEPDGTLAKLLMFVLEPQTPGSADASLKSYARGCRDPIALESFGLVALACGDSPRSRCDALPLGPCRGLP
jgi:hypothetical protein